MKKEKEKNNTLISVIIPIYNAENYLKKCIDSIINQTYYNLEIILVDDGSNDNSPIICDNYKKIDNRIKVFHKENGGLSSARNYGIDVATGELIGFVDSDDYIETNMYSSLFDNMKKYDSDIAICGVNYSKKTKMKYSKIEFVSKNKKKFDNLHNEYSLITVVSWNKIYKSELFENIRFPEGKIHEDEFVICELLEKANKVSYILKPLYNYMNGRKGSIMNTFTIHRLDAIDAYDKKIEFLKNKGYHDLELYEKVAKCSNGINIISKIKSLNLFEEKKDIFNHYYENLLITSQDIMWKDANKYIRRFKLLKKYYIYYRSLEYRIYRIIKKIIHIK